MQPATQEQSNHERQDSARKALATATARAARLAIEVHSIGPDAWLLRHASGAPIGRVQGLEALTAVVAGFEGARADMQALVRRLSRGAA